MSRAHDRMKLRQVLDNIEVLGVAMPSLMSSSELSLRPPDGVPQVSVVTAPSGSTGTWTVTPAPPLAAPAPLPPLVAAPLATAPAPTATSSTGAPSTPKNLAQPSFFNTNVPGINRPLWQVGIGTVGVLAIGIGVLKLVSSMPKRFNNYPTRGYSR